MYSLSEHALYFRTRKSQAKVLKPMCSRRNTKNLGAFHGQNIYAIHRSTGVVRVFSRSVSNSIRGRLVLEKKTLTDRTPSEDNTFPSFAPDYLGWDTTAR